MPRLIYRPANEDAPRPVFEDDAPLAMRLIRADKPTVCPQIEDDAPTLGLALEEDSPAAWRPASPWAVRAPVYQDAEDVGVLGLALEDDQGLMIRRITSDLANHRLPADDDLPVAAAAALAFEDDGGAPARAMVWMSPLLRPAAEDEVPVLVPFEEDAFPVRGSPVVALLRPPPQDAEDVPALHGISEDDRWVLTVPPRSNWLWWPSSPDGDWAPVPPGTVPGRAGLALVPQNRQGLALARVAAMQLRLAASGRLALALVRSGPSQLSLSPVGRLSLSLTRSG